MSNHKHQWSDGYYDTVQGVKVKLTKICKVQGCYERKEQDLTKENIKPERLHSMGGKFSTNWSK